MYVLFVVYAAVSFSYYEDDNCDDNNMEDQANGVVPGAAASGADTCEMAVYN
jgi:hypothetical protein